MRKKVTVILTDGTIAMGVGRRTGGAVPLVSGEQSFRNYWSALHEMT